LKSRVKTAARIGEQTLSDGLVEVNIRGARVVAALTCVPCAVRFSERVLLGDTRCEGRLAM
jgi:hypothetical protein